MKNPPTRRARRTRTVVRLAERVMRLAITVGGIGTIASVGLMFVFLVSVALPLFRGAHVDAAVERPLPDGATGERLLSDERGVLLASFAQDGTVAVQRIDDGRALQRLAPFADAPPTAWSLAPGNHTREVVPERALIGPDPALYQGLQAELTGQTLALGFADGSVRLGLAGFVTVFLTEDRVPAALASLAQGTRAELAGGLVERTREGGWRWSAFALQLDPPAASAHASPVRLLAHATDARGGTFVAWHEDGSLELARASEKRDWMTDELTVEVEEHELATADVRQRGAPGWLLLSGAGDNAYAIWEDGWLARWDVSDPGQAVVVETVDLVTEPAARVTAARMLLGQTTLMVGDSLGRTRGWFRVKPEDAGTADGSVLAPAHALEGPASPVTALATAPRGRVVACGHADGSVAVYTMTTGAFLAGAQARSAPVRALDLVAQEDRLLGVQDGELVSWGLDLGHPEAGLHAFFGSVWYEGYERPGHTWQSEGAGDEFEPKLGLVPLVFGTLKATVYSMLFGVPLALLAAVYTSEFLDRRLRTPVKSSIEMMASLPSVVLGFLAGVVIAPFAASVLPATMAVFVTLPMCLLLGAYGWQLLPARRALAWSRWQRLAAIALALPIAVAAAAWLGPLGERALFGGDLVLWLDGQTGSAFGGWLLLLLPLAGAGVFALQALVVGPSLRRRSKRWSRRLTGLTDLARFLAGLVVTLALAALLAVVLDVSGLDPRGSLVGTYDSRNALVVGFVMGFAIIPIIYTLAEDALAGIPQHLRQASLSAGATTWQTTVRVVVPTAMSGLFSALMIGLGRAVGETMIVLMAVGNTPIMEWNVFNGFRTLSANIAVELPEAVQDSTHYRTLFFAGLLLFAMTFVLNTVAELVRLRYRRRSVQL